MDAVGALAEIGVKVGLAAALALGATAAARWLYRSRTGLRTSGRALRVLETTSLGPQRAVHLIGVGERTLLIASTSNQIVMLAEVTGDEPAAREEKGGPRLGFASVLTAALGGRAGGQSDGAAGGPRRADQLREAASALRGEPVAEGRA